MSASLRASGFGLANAAERLLQFGLPTMTDDVAESGADARLVPACKGHESTADCEGRPSLIVSKTTAAKSTLVLEATAPTATAALPVDDAGQHMRRHVVRPP